MYKQPETCKHCNSKLILKPIAFGMSVCIQCGQHYFTAPVPKTETGQLLAELPC